LLKDVEIGLVVAVQEVQVKVDGRVAVKNGGELTQACRGAIIVSHVSHRNDGGGRGGGVSRGGRGRGRGLGQGSDNPHQERLVLVPIQIEANLVCHQRILVN
jgi:hypothetical protein